MDFFILKEKILLRCSQPSILSKTNVTQQIFLFEGLALKQASAQIVFTAMIIQLNEMYFLFYDQAWKHYPVYIVIRLLSVQVHRHLALLAWQAQMMSHHTRQKKYELHMIARIHNIACANCLTCNYFFLKQTVNAK